MNNIAEITSAHCAPGTPGVQGLLQPLRPWLDDASVSEILINRPEEVWVEKNEKLTAHPVLALTPLHLQRLFQLIANDNQQRLSKKEPLLSGSLPDGSRVQLCLPPTAKYHTLSIRRNVTKAMSLDDYATSPFYHSARHATGDEANRNHLPETEQQLIQLYQHQAWDAFIRKAIQSKKNMVISGGTASGKTTFLNACLQHIDNNERLILLEDTRELNAPHRNHVQLLASKGEQGEAHVTMQDLLQCCLRLRPDRIVMGEVRGKEILDFIGSCATGHDGAMTSIHANSPAIAFMRMTQLYKLNNVPSMTDSDILRELQSVIDIIIQLAKTSAGRRVQGIYYKYGEHATHHITEPNTRKTARV